MPVRMAPHQLAFWQELLAPFHPDELSEVPARGNKKILTYIDKRALSNRLDSVCGPDGWDVEYEATARGYKCRLGILCPTPNGSAVWHHKEDGAGFEEMGSKNKETGEFEYDVDNDEKSGYTNAFRRAAQDAWGIGRYLYRKGIPSFLDPDASAPAAAKPPALPPIDPGMAAASVPPKELADRSAPSRPPAQPQGDGKTFDNYKIPKAGKSVFPWAKGIEREFETQIVNGMRQDGESNGWGGDFTAWDQEKVHSICMNAICHVREMPTYKGQFEHLFQAKQPNGKQSQAPGVNIADLRKTLLARMQELVTKQTGKPTDNVGLKAVFSAVAPIAKNGDGHTGEVPESLARTTDAVWIKNMIAIVEAQIAEAEAGEADPDCPF